MSQQVPEEGEQSGGRVALPQRSRSPSLDACHGGAPWCSGVVSACSTTGGGQVGARWVIHVVGPNHRAGERDRSLLESCYSGALGVADELGARTVAFPLISAGIYGWPFDDAVLAAVETLRATPTDVHEARLVAFDQRAYAALRAAVG